MGEGFGDIAHSTGNSGVGAFQFDLYAGMLTREDLLGKVRWKDDGSIGITMLKGGVNLSGSDVDGFQFILARQEFIDKRIDRRAICVRGSNKRESMNATGIGKHQVEQRHDKYRHDKDERESAPITQNLVNDAAGESHDTYNTHCCTSCSWRLAK